LAILTTPINHEDTPMLSRLHDGLLLVHVAAGALALVCFWLPMLARKGGHQHRRTGHWFVNIMYVVTGTGLAMSALVLLAPLAVGGHESARTPAEFAAAAERARVAALFLLMLSLLVLASVRHGWLALRAARDPAILRHPMHLLLLVLLGVAGLVAATVGTWRGELLLQIFAAVALVTSWRLGRESRAGRAPDGGWLVAHLRGMLVGGIGAYTAFFVFGGSRLFADLLTGYWQLLPWVLPGLVGGLLIHRYGRRYRQRRPTAA
jgi:hypothetical protein